jgi:hypothetical protein
MEKVTAFWEGVALPGVKGAMGFELPEAGGHPVRAASHEAFQMKVGVSPVTLVVRAMGWVEVAEQITCRMPGEVEVTGMGLTLKVKSVGTPAEQPPAVGMI